MTSGRASNGAGTGTREAPIGLYVHFPFCAARCHYCAFYFEVGRADEQGRYLAAVASELARAGEDERFAGRTVDSIYFGGGTPSLMPASALEELLGEVRRVFPVPPAAEVSLEANPDGLGPEHFRALRLAGVNRITLGFQSLRAANLRALTRTHSPEQNVQALAWAREAGFDNVGVDMIFGLPEESPEAWREEIERVAGLGPDHVSAYELTMEEGTRFFRRHRRGDLVLPDEDARARMFEETEEILAGAGILRYEISNFATPGHECRHNVSGWRSGDLLGVGASAASHVANVRWTSVCDLDRYVARVEAGESPIAELEELDPVTWAAEDLYLGLRLADGLDVEARLGDLPGSGRVPLDTALEQAREAGLVQRDGPRARLTRRGLLLADTVFEALLVR